MPQSEGARLAAARTPQPRTVGHAQLRTAFGAACGAARVSRRREAVMCNHKALMLIHEQQAAVGPELSVNSAPRAPPGRRAAVMAAPGPSAGAVALHPLPAGGVAPFAACVRLTAELRAALLAHAQAPHGAAASVTFSAAGAGAVRARVSAFAVAAFGRSRSARVRCAAHLAAREGLPVRVVRRGGGHLQPLRRGAGRGRAPPGGRRATVRPSVVLGRRMRGLR